MVHLPIVHLELQADKVRQYRCGAGLRFYRDELHADFGEDNWETVVVCQWEWCKEVVALKRTGRC
jgi:hypothetical protein